VEFVKKERESKGRKGSPQKGRSPLETCRGVPGIREESLEGAESLWGLEQESSEERESCRQLEEPCRCSVSRGGGLQGAVQR